MTQDAKHALDLQKAALSAKKDISRKMVQLNVWPILLVVRSSQILELVQLVKMNFTLMHSKIAKRNQNFARLSTKHRQSAQLVKTHTNSTIKCKDVSNLLDTAQTKMTRKIASNVSQAGV